MIEEWRVIQDFPDYEVSNFGEIVNTHTDVYIRTSLTQQGGLKVGLVRDGKQYTRSVKVLVAKHFVQGESEVYNTPMLLDGNQENCAAQNIVWRPRWFAWQYARQYNTDIPEFYQSFTILELDDEGLIIRAYSDVVDAAVSNGLLFIDIWKSIHTHKATFPTGQNFRSADKV